MGRFHNRATQNLWSFSASWRVGGDGGVRRLRRHVGLQGRGPLVARAQDDGRFPHRGSPGIAKAFPEQERREFVKKGAKNATFSNLIKTKFCFTEKDFTTSDSVSIIFLNQPN